MGKFIIGLIKGYDKHSVLTDVGKTWYSPQGGQFLKQSNHIHFSFEKSIIERTLQYDKDRTEI